MPFKVRGKRDRHGAGFSTPEAGFSHLPIDHIEKESRSTRQLVTQPVWQPENHRRLVLINVLFTVIPQNTIVRSCLPECRHDKEKVSAKRGFSEEGHLFEVGILSVGGKKPTALRVQIQPLKRLIAGEFATNLDLDPRDLPQPRGNLFDLSGQLEAEKIVCTHGHCGGVAVSLDGKTLAGGGAGAVHLFDVSK